MSSKILALDTATEACSAALLYNNSVIYRYQLAPRQHTQLILPMLQSLLDEAGLSLTQLDAIAFGRGPGSFTGIRIAASVIHGMAFATDLPVIPVSTLQALAQSAWREQQLKSVITAIDARMDEIYWCAYQLEQDNRMSPIIPEMLGTPASIELSNPNSFIGIGSGWDSYHTIMQPKLTSQLTDWLPNRYPHAQDIAILAATDFQNGQTVSAEYALPVYLRDQVTK